MTKRLIGIILIALLIPAPIANAKTYHAPKHKVPKYTYKVTTSAHYKCPYAGCHSNFKKH
jgi:hypothetical protein